MKVVGKYFVRRGFLRIRKRFDQLFDVICFCLVERMTICEKAAVYFCMIVVILGRFHSIIYRTL
jgi:hypothetical protein